MAIFKKDSSKLSKKLLSIALAATMMCGTGALAGTVATVSNLPVSAATANIVDGNGDLASLAVNTVFTASGITYKITSVGDSVTAPKAMITSIDEDYFLNKNTLALAISNITVSYKDTDGSKKTTAVTIAQVGDGTNSLVASWSTDNKSKFKSVQVGSQVVTIAKNAFKDVFKLYDAEDKSSSKPVLTLGNGGDHYGMALTSFDTTGMPDTEDFIVETESLNVVGANLTASTKNYGYINGLNTKWTFKAYWGSYAWSVYTAKNGAAKFQCAKTISLTAGVSDKNTGATFAFYLAAPKSVSTLSGKGGYAQGPRTPNEYNMAGEWRFFAFNAGSNVLNQTADKSVYNANSTIFSTNSYSSTLASGSYGLKDVLNFTFDVYNKTLKFTPKSGVGAFSGMTEWNMNEEIAISNDNKNVIEILTKKKLYTHDANGKDPELTYRNGYYAALGYKLSGNYGSGLLLLAGNGYNDYVTVNNSNNSSIYLYNYTIPSNTNNNSNTDALDKVETTISFNSNASNKSYGPLPLSGTYTLSFAKEVYSTSASNIAYAVSADTKVVDGYCNIKLSGLTKGYTYQLLYTTMKTSGFDSNSVSNFESVWLNKWKVMTATPLDKNGKYTVANNATDSDLILTVNNAFAANNKTGYMICLKTYDAKGNEVRKSYGVVNSGDLRAYMAANDTSTGKRPKVFNADTVLRAYRTNANDTSTLSAPTLVVGMLVDCNKLSSYTENGKSYYTNVLDNNYTSQIYLVDKDGVVTNIGASSQYRTATANNKYSLYSSGTGKNSLYMMSSTTLSAERLQNLKDGKYTIYVTRPYYSSTSSSSTYYYQQQFLNPDSLIINNVATTVQKVGVINISSLGFKLSKTSEKAGTGVGMVITKNGLTTTKMILQEKVTTGTGTSATTSWVDVDMPTTAKITASDGTVSNVLLSKTGFTTASASILPIVGEHTYRIKSVGTNSIEHYSNEQTVTITAGFKNYPTIKLGTNTVYGGSAVTQMKKANGTSTNVYVPRSRIKSVKMAGSNPFVAVALTKIANADVYGLGTGKNVSTTFYIANGDGCVASKDDWGDAIGSVVLSPKQTGATLATTAVVDTTGATALKEKSSDGFYELKTTSINIKTAGQYFVKAVSTFKDSSGADQKATRYYFFNVTE